ncbi:MAG TPA: hypothetical protein VFQ53_39935 [Kofleriaceae bacterium]|nr:hypothetical protein [Kofleriaceae bacterium]
MRRMLLLLVIALAGPPVLATSASAQPATDPGPGTGPGPHREGDYGGVAPGQGQPEGGKPARPKRPPAKGTLTWIGFEAKDGGAQVFFQSVAAFEVTQRVEGGTLVAHLSLTRLGRNTWRQIDTRFFDNPLSGIVARATGAVKATKKRAGHGRGIDVRFTFKNPKDAREATVKTGAEADGMYYVYLTFPEGADAKQAPADEPEK